MTSLDISPHTPYTVALHQHRFAAWAASRAASVKGCRFEVRQGAAILETSGFHSLAFQGPECLPDATAFDSSHQEWRVRIMESAEKFALPFTHGIAAKLINIYLKSRIVCAGHHLHNQVLPLHPPIDRELLDALAGRNVGGNAREWRRLKNQSWSKFDSSTYERAVHLIKSSLPDGTPLWMIEAHWKGYQGNELTNDE